jgi:hypothetical protein
VDEALGCRSQSDSLPAFERIQTQAVDGTKTSYSVSLQRYHLPTCCRRRSNAVLKEEPVSTCSQAIKKQVRKYAPGALPEPSFFSPGVKI